MRAFRTLARRGGGCAAALSLAIAGMPPALALETDPGPPAEAPGATPATDPADALIGSGEHSQRPVTWTLTLHGVDEDLEALLRRHLDLARYAKLAQDERITRVELARLLAATPAQGRGLLETEGYFSARVSARIDEGGSAPPPAGADAPQALAVRVDVEPGERTRVGEVQIVFEGALAAAAEAGDTQAAALMARIRADWELPSGAAFTQRGWGDAKSAVLGRARTEAYAAAALSGSVAQVDTAGHLASLFVVLDSGPLFRFGALEFEGLDHVRPDAITALANFAPGDPLREQTLQDFQDRLIKSSLFETVGVLYEPDTQTAGATPLTVKVTEQALQTATFGVGVSDQSGPRMTIEHLHQRPFGFGWQAKTRTQLGRDSQSLSLDLTSHPQPGPYRNLIGAALARNDASGLRVTSERLRLGRTQDTERIERLYFVEWQRAMTRDLSSGLMTDDTKAATLNYHWVWRDLDHPLLPTRGFSLSAETAVGRSYASTDRSGFFSRATARATAYLPLGAGWQSQSRLQLGQVFSRQTVAVPFTLLFRAGGDDSVRGYSLQSLGPRDPADGTAVGGRVLGTGSVELAHPLSRRSPDFLGAVFVDGGNADTSWNNFQPAYGWGFGLRWRSPVGPLRIDLAYGEEVRRWRLHFNVGITF